jgi:hypothetical protein
LHIFELFIEEIPYDKAISFLELLRVLINLDELLEAENYEEKARQSIKSIILHVRNPIKVIVHMIMLVNSVEEQFPNLKQVTIPLQENLVKIGACLINLVNSIEVMRMIMKEKYHNGYTVLRLIAVLDITKMLENPMIDQLVAILWESPYTIDHYTYQDFEVTF